MASEQFCRHFPEGGIMKTHCAVGIVMMSVADKEARPLLLPCCNPEAKHLCDHYQPYSAAEIAETEAAVTAFIKKLNTFSQGDSRVCPTCGAGIEQIVMYEKIEPETYSLYTRPCNHRHGLWSNAPAWAHDAGIVHVIPLGFDDEADES